MHVGAHPHTALQTFTWLIDGEVLHRDSLGNEQVIRPGQVNLMTAGHGIVHTEDSLPDARRLHAAQLWIALPPEHADCRRPDAPNRIFMAPLTRCRAGEEHIANALMAEHYAQRASAGLLIAEATMAVEGNSAFWREPGIYGPAQVAGWKLVTDAVHAAGGRIFLQIWHGGRACHPAAQRRPAAGQRQRAGNPQRQRAHAPRASSPTSCRACSTTPRFPASSPASARRPRMPRPPASTASRCMAPTATCSTSSCATAATAQRPLRRPDRESRAADAGSARGGQPGLGFRPRRPAHVAAQQLQRHARQRPGRPRHLAGHSASTTASWPTCT
jgi:hypothetical protein